jgi:hypothetical protein
MLRWVGASLLVLALALAPPAAASSARVGDAVARVDGSTVTLANSRIERTWRVAAGAVAGAGLRDARTGRQWALPGPDFEVDLDGVTTSSLSAWKLAGVTATARAGAPEIILRYRLLTTELDRTFTLRPGEAVVRVESTLVNRGAAPVRVGRYTLDEVASRVAAAEVQAYHGGADWRDDYRASSTQTGAFDSEGEVARFDDGAGSGWFFVAERRGGAMSRVGRTTGGVGWVGVDPARDLLDLGPLASSPPSYNRLENPAYPAPVRARTVPPFGRLDLGRAFTGVYSGGAQEAAAAFVDDFAAHEMPNFARTVGLNTFHPWQHGPGLSDANLRPQVDAARALGLESFMLDDQWQGASGDWQFNSTRFPEAGHPFVDHVHGAGLQLGLWMSPAEFNPNSSAYKQHPDWACTPTGDITAQIPDDAGLGVWDVTNPGFRAYLIGVIDRLVSTYGVREFKFDFTTWVDCPPHDYLDYEDAFVSLVRTFEARHPTVTFELDETNDQRLWPFESAALGPSWFDNGHLHGSTAEAKLLHDLWSAAPWLPTSSIGFGTYDGTLAAPYTVDYLMPMTLLSHVTFWSDLTKLSPADARETRRWIAWYKAHRGDLAGLVYEDSASDPIDGRAWAAFQPWRDGHGELFTFRQAGGPPSERIALYGTAPHVAYTVTDALTGTTVGRYTGTQLAAGLPVTLPQPYSAAVLEIRPTS